MSVPTTMQAVRLHAARTPTAPEDVRIDEVPVPQPRPGEVLVRVHACGVCASDLHVVQGVTPTTHLPIILGHEAAGTVAVVGAGAGDWAIGQAVVVPAMQVCGRCNACQAGRENLCEARTILSISTHGAQAEYVCASATGLVAVPAGVPLEQAAIVADAVATPYHALRRSGLAAGMSCVVIGLGGLGMHAVSLAKLAGAQVIGVDVDHVNLERAVAWGADDVVDASDGAPAGAIRALSGGGVDRSFEFVGTAATAHVAVQSLRTGGRATLVGVGRDRLATVPLGVFVAGELEVVGSFGQTAADVREVLSLVANGRLDLSRSVSHRLGFDEFPAALRMLETREGHPVRIVVTPPALIGPR